MSEIRLRTYVNGALIDPTGSLVETGNPGNDYGVQRLDTFADVVDSQEAFTRLSIGYYRLVFSDPAENLDYRWGAHFTYAGTVYYVEAEMVAGIQTTTVISPNITSHYTSQAEVLRVMGVTANELLIEDTESKDLVWEDLLDEADDTIKMYVNQHYDTSTLYTSKWVRRKATTLVAGLLSQRRGNPGLYGSRIERVYDELMMIRDGRMHIPDKKPKSFQGPVVRNYIMQNRFLTHPLRVDSTKSTGDSYANEDIALEPYIFYGGRV